MMPPSWRAITPEHLQRWRERLGIHEDRLLPIDPERVKRMAWVWIKISNDPTARELRGGVISLTESDWLHTVTGT